MPGLLLEDLLHPTNVSPNLNPGRIDASAEDVDMGPRHPSNTPGGGSSKQSGRQRRARSQSQPGTPGGGGSQPSAGPSTPRLSEIDFGLMQHPFGGGREGGGMFPVPAGYDEDAIGRALRAIQQDAPAPGIAAPQQPHPDPKPVMGPPSIPLLPQAQGASGVPQVTEMFLAALPWLQYLQIQQQEAGAGQLPHHTPQEPGSMPPHMHGQRQHGQLPLHPQQHQHELSGHQQPQQHQQRMLSPSQFGVMPPRRPSSQPQQHASFAFMPPPHQQTSSFSAGHFGTLPPLEASSSQMEGIMPLPPMQRSSSAGDTPSPEAGYQVDPTETEAVAIAEDKRRRNTAASARFRIKKKQWTLNLERTIGDLSGRVEELEREASELRRENGWLKEIVMLKSKRLAGIVPELEPSPSGSGSGESGAGGSGGRGPGGEKTPDEDSEDEAEEADQQQRTRRGRNEKGKGRQQS